MKSSRLNLFDLTMIVVSLVIGMGIFRTPVNVARHAGSADMFFIAWIVGGLVALCGALTYAEIGSRYPVTGGYYKIFSYCYHPSIAFAINCIILVSNAASLAGVALIGSEYLANVLFKGHTNINAIKLVISTMCGDHFLRHQPAGIKNERPYPECANGDKDRVGDIFDRCFVYRRLCHYVYPGSRCSTGLS